MAGNFPYTEAFVRKYADQVEQEIINRAISEGKYATGKLIKSLRKQVRESKEGIALRFYFVKPGSDYADFVDKGVSGAGVPNGFKGKKKAVARSKYYKFTNKMPPEKSIKSWMRIHGIPKKASYPIRRSIFIFGIQPTWFFTIPTTRRKDQFNKGVEKALAKDFQESILKEFKKK
jgi:hypothetical protein